MKGLKQFAIDIIGLKIGQHEFEYSIDDAFFQNFELSPVTEGQLAVKVVLDKSERMLNLELSLEGNVTLTCDRSLDEFQHPINESHELVFKFGEEEKELGDDIYMIHWDTQQLNVAQFIYEFVVLAIPLKKLHPRYLEDEDFEDELIYTAEADIEEPEEEQKVDPRWEALKQLKKDSGA